MAIIVLPHFLAVPGTWIFQWVEPGVLGLPFNEAVLSKEGGFFVCRR